MIMIPSGMAESDGGSEETVVLTDPLDPRHPRQAFGQGLTAMLIASVPMAGLNPDHRFRRKGRPEWLRTRSQI